MRRRLRMIASPASRYSRTGRTSTEQVAALHVQRDRRNIYRRSTPGDVRIANTHSRALTGRLATKKVRGLKPGLFSLTNRAGVTPPGRPTSCGPLTSVADVTSPQKRVCGVWVRRFKRLLDLTCSCEVIEACNGAKPTVFVPRKRLRGAACRGSTKCLGIPRSGALSPLRCAGHRMGHG